MYVIRELQDRPLKLNLEQSQREQYTFFSAPDTRYIGSTQSLSCQLVLSTQYQYDGGCLVILHILNLDTWSLGSGQKNWNLGQTEQKNYAVIVFIFSMHSTLYVLKNQIPNQCINVVVTFYLRLKMNFNHFPPKTRPLIGRFAGSANKRPGFWREIA